MAVFALAAILTGRATADPHEVKLMRLDEVTELTTCTIPCDYGDSLARVVLWENTIRWNNAARWFAVVKQNAEAAHRSEVVPSKDQRSGSSVSVSAPSSGHNPCAEPIPGLLPNYIVQRESRGQCGAYNANGCSGRGCIGWAQVDAGHFAARSPWNPNVPGTCYGLTYNACVNRLSGGGSNLGPWGG